MSAAGPVRLSFSVFGGRLQCAVAQETLSHKAYLPYDEARILAASRELIAVLTRGNRQRKLTEACLHDLRTIGEELYRQLIPEAAREDLAEADGRPVLLEVDESLVPVPWELLYDGQRFLCRRFDLGRAVSTPQPRRAQGARRMGRPARVLVICSDPRGDLEAVAHEGQAIVDELDPHPDVKVRIVSGRTVDDVRKVVKDYDVVHFAGHADYDRADPEASGWHLADGKLAARDVAALAGGRPMPLVVFSNACQSSHETHWRADDPGRVFGLANAFLLSGVKFYVGTQWEIVDAQSHAFARVFYAELARGRSMGNAVRRAREAVIVAEGEGGLGWAGYVLYGDPAFVPLGASDPLRTSSPPLPTPADIVSRESIRGVVKVKKHPSGEHVLAPTRGGMVFQITASAPQSGPVAAAATAAPADTPAPLHLPPDPSVSHAVPPGPSLRANPGVWIFATVFIVSVTAVVLALVLTR